MCVCVCMCACVSVYVFGFIACDGERVVDGRLSVLSLDDIPPAVIRESILSEGEMDDTERTLLSLSLYVC